MKLMKFRLLAGMHQGPDYTQEPAELTDAKGNKTYRWPSRIYQQGEVVEDKVDLVQKLGAAKFQLLSGPAEALPGSPLQASSVAPGGQVSQGFQQTTTGPDGSPLSGPLTKDVRVPQPAVGPRPSQQAKEQLKQTTGRGVQEEELDEPEVPEDAPVPGAVDVEQQREEQEEYDAEGRLLKAEGKASQAQPEEGGEEEEASAGSKAEQKKAQTQPSKEFKKSELDRMSASELKALAKKEGVDLKGATKREDLIGAFKAK